MYILIGNDWAKKSKLSLSYFKALRCLTTLKTITVAKEEITEVISSLLTSIDAFAQLPKYNLWTNVDTIGFRWYGSTLEIVERINGMSWDSFTQKYPLRAEIFIKLGLIRDSLPPGSTLAKKQDLERIFHASEGI